MPHQKAVEVFNNILKDLCVWTTRKSESLPRGINKNSVNVYTFCHDVEAFSIFKKSLNRNKNDKTNKLEEWSFFF